MKSFQDSMVPFGIKWYLSETWLSEVHISINTPWKLLEERIINKLQQYLVNFRN